MARDRHVNTRFNENELETLAKLADHYATDKSTAIRICVKRHADELERTQRDGR